MKATSNLFLIFTILLSSTLSSSRVFASEDCPSGQYYDSQLNRCIMTTDTAEVKANVSACEGLEGEEFKECFQSNASDQVSSMESEGLEKLDNNFKKGNGMKLAVPLAVSLLTSYYLFLNKEKFKSCKSTSIWLLFGAGVTSFVGEISAQITYKNKTKDLENKFKKRMSEYESTSTDEEKYKIINENQEVSFEYLKESEQARLTAEKVRFGTYTLASGLYAGAAVAAIVEGLSKTGVCKSTAAVQESNFNMGFNFLQVVDNDYGRYHFIKNITYSEFIEIGVRKVASLILPSAHASSEIEHIEVIGNLTDCAPGTSRPEEKIEMTDEEGFKSMGRPCLSDNPGNDIQASSAQTNGIGGFFKENFNKLLESPLKGKQFNFLDRAMTTPIIRAGIAVAVGAYTTTIAVQAKKNIDILKKRISAINKLKSDFISNSQGLQETCNMVEAQDGEPDACAGIRAKGYEKYQASNYDMLAKNTEAVTNVCMDEDNKIDEDCKCRQTNSCTVIPSSFSFGGLGNSSWAQALAGPTNQLLTGSISGAELDTADLTNKSYALKNQLKKMEQDPKFSAAVKKVKSLGEKIQKSNGKLYKKSFPSGTPASLASFGADISSKIPTSAKDIASSVKAKIAQSSKDKFSNGSSTERVTGSTSNSLNFDWGDSAAGGKGGVQIDNLASVMDKKFKIDGDINKNSSQDIFKILSIRYQRSGLRRLFDETGTSSMDEANEEQINEQ